MYTLSEFQVRNKRLKILTSRYRSTVGTICEIAHHEEVSCTGKI